jgi:sulfotransferase family protein
VSEAGKRREAGRPESWETAVEQLEQTRKRLARRNKEIAELRERLGLAEMSADGTENTGVRPENIVWIFGTGRSGSTWLASMMEEVEGHAMWSEPLVGALFGEFYYVRAAHKKGGKSIMGRRYRDVWLRSIRSIVLDGATARYPGLTGGGYLVIKEPHGSIGAPLLMEALPESRMVFLVRDPRDVAASALDGHRGGSWTTRHRMWEGKKRETTADTDPDAFVRQRADIYLQDVGNAKEAFDAHSGRKALVRYEDLRSDTLATMKRVYAGLEIPVHDEELARAVKEHSWENIPEEKKGEGKFYRKARPGGWNEDLTPGQARIVEQITAPLLDEFYPGWKGDRGSALA